MTIRKIKPMAETAEEWQLSRSQERERQLALLRLPHEELVAKLWQRVMNRARSRLYFSGTRWKGIAGSALRWAGVPGRWSSLTTGFVCERRANTNCRSLLASGRLNSTR